MMNRTFVIMAATLGATPARAQQAPTPTPTSPTSMPAATPGSTPVISSEQAVVPETPPTDTQPVQEQAPAEPPAPPPPQSPPAPAPAGLVASMSADQHLADHPRAYDRETPTIQRFVTAGVFVDYQFSAGPRVAGSFGVFRGFELYLGEMRDTLTMKAVGSTPAMASKTTRFMSGMNIALISYAGFHLAGGLMVLSGQGDTKNMSYTGALSLQLDAHWLPFHVANTRVRINYPFGIGIEWGAL